MNKFLEAYGYIEHLTGRVPAQADDDEAHKRYMQKYSRLLLSYMDSEDLSVRETKLFLNYFTSATVHFNPKDDIKFTQWNITGKFNGRQLIIKTGKTIHGSDCFWFEGIDIELGEGHAVYVPRRN